MEYFTLFIIAFLVNVVPEFAPPTWTVMSPFLFIEEINIPLVILATITGATLGRLILITYIEKIGDHVFNDWQKDNLSFIASKISRTDFQNMLFVFLYSLTPLSTGALFIAAGFAKLKKSVTLIGYFLGRLISYSVIAYSISYGIDAFRPQGGFDNFHLATSVITAVILVFSLLFIDWKALLENKKIMFNFKIWRWDK